MKKIFILVLIFIAASSTLIPLRVTAISGACSWHNGVNCGVGATYDGKVMCNDGWVNSSVYFYNADECKTTPTINCFYKTCYTPRVDGCISESDYESRQALINRLGHAFTMDPNQELTDCRNQIVAYQTALIAYDSCVTEARNEYNKCVDDTLKLQEDVVNKNMIFQRTLLCVQTYGANYSYDEVTQKCICKNCVTDQTCQNKYGQNSLLKNGQCVCKDGYTQEFDPANHICYSVNFCPQGAILKSTSGSCECREGYTLNKDKNKCISQDDWCKERYSNLAYFDTANGVCACSRWSSMSVDRTACVANQASTNTIDDKTTAKITNQTTANDIKSLPTKAPIKIDLSQNKNQIILPANLNNTTATSSAPSINDVLDAENKTDKNIKPSIFNGLKKLIQSVFSRLKFW